MTDLARHYPKFLAFIQLFYPALYKKISIHSDKPDFVEANLICSNNNHSFQAIVYSEDVAKEGELFEIYTGKDSKAPYSWDWRWVFAIKILFAEEIIFHIKFKQKVIALPTGKHPLAGPFFNILDNEFKNVLDELGKDIKNNHISVKESYTHYCRTMNL